MEVNYYIDWTDQSSTVLLIALQCNISASRSQRIRAAESQTLTSAFVPSRTRDDSGPQPLSCTAFLPDYTSELPKAALPDVLQFVRLHLEGPAPDATVTIKDDVAASGSGSA